MCRSRATEIAGRSSRLVRARIARERSRPPASSRTPARCERSRLTSPARARSAPMPPGRLGSPSRTARGCARRGGRPGRRPSAGSGSSPRDRRAASRAMTHRATTLGEHRPAASRRSTGRRRRRRRLDWPAPPEAAPSGAGRDRGPAPRRRADARSDRATAPTAPPSASRTRTVRATRSSKSRPPDSAIAASYATKVRAISPASGSAATAAASTPMSSLSREIAVSRARQPAGPAAGAIRRRRAIRSTSGSTGRLASRRISSPSAWNVRTRTASPDASTPRGARAPASRSRSSSAARLLNVIAAISSAAAAPDAISHATRATSVVVLPLPAGATQRIGPGGATAASRWSGARRASISATEECTR